MSYSIGSEPISGYRLRRYLGRGGTGEVWEVEAPGGVAKAMKIALAESHNPELMQREFEGLQKIRSIRHPFLLSIDRFEVVDGRLIIVTELADESLIQRYEASVERGLKGIPRGELLRYLKEASEVLDALNETHGLQHLDVKPTNLLLSAGHVKVADFGLVQPRGGDLSERTLAFSPGYAPPELFDGQVHQTADQYSLAITYQELLTGTWPFQGDSLVELVGQQQEGDPDLASLPIDDQIIIRRAIHPDVSKRFENCTRFVEALHKPIEYIRTTSPTQFRVHSPRSRQPLGLNSNGAAAVGAAARPKNLEARENRTVAVRKITTKQTRTLGPAGAKDGLPRDQVRATFLAALPIEMYVLKLRAFIQALDAEIGACDQQSTVLILRPRRRWFFRSKKGLYLKLDTYTPNPESQCSVVDVTIWSDAPELRGEALSNRGILLIRVLKAYFLASDHSHAFSFEPAVIRRQLWETT